MIAETQRIIERYARRSAERDANLYGISNAGVLMSVQERERALWRWLRESRLGAPERLQVLEIGCGSGRTLLDLLRLGFQPHLIIGNDLSAERLRVAGARLPKAIEFHCCDAMELPAWENSFDVVLQSAVFTSILDPAYQESLAHRMWTWARPGGGVLWYDFTCDNPRNPDVKGVPFRRIRQLFPEAARIWKRRITLAPPVSRWVTKLHPALYLLCNTFPLLRTHYLCWIEKRAVNRS